MINKHKIKNFILIKFLRKDWLLPTQGPHALTTEQIKSYEDSQNVLLYRAIEQIKYFHPSSNIHILTNDETITFEDNKIIKHYKNETWNLLCKLQLYGLLEEPAVFIDSDIVFVKPLSNLEDYYKYPFYFFNRSWVEKLSFYSNNLPVENNIVYNSGVVLINKPSQKLVAELQNLHNEYFNDVNFILSNNKIPYNDEHAPSLYALLNNYKMPIENSKINVMRNRLKKLNITLNEKNINQFQSIHYSGLVNKTLMIQEYPLFPISKNHTNKQVKEMFCKS
jgi:hypothetical protein